MAFTKAFSEFGRLCMAPTLGRLIFLVVIAVAAEQRAQAALLSHLHRAGL